MDLGWHLVSQATPPSNCKSILGSGGTLYKDLFLAQKFGQPMFIIDESRILKARNFFIIEDEQLNFCTTPFSLMGVVSQH